MITPERQGQTEYKKKTAAKIGRSISLSIFVRKLEQDECNMALWKSLRIDDAINHMDNSRRHQSITIPEVLTLFRAKHATGKSGSVGLILNRRIRKRHWSRRCWSVESSPKDREQP